MVATGAAASAGVCQGLNQLGFELGESDIIAHVDFIVHFDARKNVFYVRGRPKYLIKREGVIQ